MSPVQLEELRRAIRAWLYDRAALAFNAQSIHRGVSRETPCTQPEVESALGFLSDLGHVKFASPEISAIKYYQIAHKGTLAHERGD